MDLNAPLGKTPPPRRRGLLPLAGGAVLLALAGALGVYLYRADPRGGEPYAVAQIPPPTAVAPASRSAIDPSPTGSTPPAQAGEPAPGDTVRMENGVKVVSAGAPGRSAQRETGPLVIDVSKALDEARRVRGLNGGATPGQDVAALPSRDATRPRVAIFVSGMGLAADATRTTIDTMPPAVSLAFVPYGDMLGASVAAARAKGHEVLLQLPMRNAQGAPPGPHALRADAPAAETAADLDWLMGRFGGYGGVVNLLGAPVTADRGAMTTILMRVHRRGAYYLDDGTSARSVAPAVAGALHVPSVQADVVLDATADPAAVRANLERLVALAKQKGRAVGMASGFPEHLAVIARFAGALDARGITLVPVGAMAKADADLATAR